MRGLNQTSTRGWLLGALLCGGLVCGVASCSAGASGNSGPSGLPGPEGPVGPAGEQGEQGADGTNGNMGTMGGMGMAGADAVLPAGIWIDGLNFASYAHTRDGLALTNRGGIVANIPIGAYDDATVGGCGISADSRTGNKMFVGFNAYDAKLANSATDSFTSIAITGRGTRGASDKFTVQILLDCDADNTPDEVAVADAKAAVASNTATTITLAANAAIWKGITGSAKCGLSTTTAAALSATVPNTTKMVNVRPIICEFPRNAVMASILVVQGEAGDATFRESIIEQVNVNTVVASANKTDMYIFKK